jgi:RNA polymerase sigma-54 factor
MDQRLTQTQTVRPEQRLIMTPSLQQAIRLLALSRLELEEEIRQEVDQNPVLVELPAQAPPPREASAPAEEEITPTPLGDSPFPVDLSWELYDEPTLREETSREPEDRDELWYEKVLPTRQTLRDHLTWQLRLSLDGEDDLAVGEEIIGNVDDDGYLRAETGEISARLGVPEARVQCLLALVQSFDPPGVAARDLRECLLIQLGQMEGRAPLAEEIVRHHFKLLENRKLDQIARSLRRTPEEVQEAAHHIGHLEPRPGRFYSLEEPQYVTPDLFIVKEEDGYRVLLNDEGLPRLRISGRYRSMMGDPGLPSGTREYLQKKISSAVWLVRSIEQRQRTIRRVAESIVRHQRDFFERGVQHLRPMVLRDIARDLGISESTVSRVTSRKYAQTPQGLYEMKYFFNTGVEQRQGTAMASASVQDLIRTMVAAEDTARPLSDDVIAQRLRRERGLVIARRTVAKYRSILNILPAAKRRRT